MGSNHAGCLRTRNSTFGVMVMLGGHCVKGNTSLQSIISLSSGESEYYGIVRGAAKGLQIQSRLADWGYISEVKVHTDSTAAKGTCSRRGLGKLGMCRHGTCGYRSMWLTRTSNSSEVKVHTDSTATKGTCFRRGLGKLGMCSHGTCGYRSVWPKRTSKSSKSAPTQIYRTCVRNPYPPKLAESL